MQKYKQMIDAWGGWALFQELLAALKTVADRHAASIAAIAARYVLDQPAVAGAIVGARLGVAEHIADNVRTFDIVLDERRPCRDRPVLGRRATSCASSAIAATSTAEGSPMDGPIEPELAARLAAIVQAAPELMLVLRTVRDLALPDRLVMSGAVYQRVLNHLTGRDPRHTASRTTMSAISMPRTSPTRPRTP